MLMSAVVDGRLPANSKFFEHVDQCLTCRACEDVCPNNVAYSQLVNQVRGALEPSRRRGKLARMMRWIALDGVAANPSGLSWAARALRYWERLGGRGLASMAQGLGLSRLGRLATVLPPVPAEQAWRPAYPAAGAVRGRVALFLGCVARVFDLETLRAAVFVLNRLGYTVDIPAGQNCCGALHAGQGELAKAGALARENMMAFSSEDWDAVIVTASGCGASLNEYPLTVGREAWAFSHKVMEIGEFLSKAESWPDAEIMSWHHGKIAVHEPCSLRNVLHGQAALNQLLQRIPGAEFVALAGNEQCCGAGGAYHLTQPEMSELLLKDKVDAMKASGARVIVSSNLGCALHLAAGARNSGMQVEVMHPVLLLARQMGYGA